MQWIAPHLRSEKGQSLRAVRTLPHATSRREDPPGAVVDEPRTLTGENDRAPLKARVSCERVLPVLSRTTTYYPSSRVLRPVFHRRDRASLIVSSRHTPSNFRQLPSILARRRLFLYSFYIRACLVRPTASAAEGERRVRAEEVREEMTVAKVLSIVVSTSDAANGARRKMRRAST